VEPSRDSFDAEPSRTTGTCSIPAAVRCEACPRVIHPAWGRTRRALDPSSIQFSPFFLAPTDFGSAGTRVQAYNIWEEGIDLLSLSRKERAGAEQEAAMPLIIGAKHVDPFLSSLLFASYNRSRICMARWGPSLAAGRTRMKIRFFPHSYSHLTDHVYALPVWRSSVWLRPDVHA
jgi:hypothetical protein